MRLDKTRFYEEHWPINKNGGRYFQDGTWFRDDFSEIVVDATPPVVEVTVDATPEDVPIPSHDTMEGMVGAEEIEEKVNQMARKWTLKRQVEERFGRGSWEKLPKVERLAAAERLLAGEG